MTKTETPDTEKKPSIVQQLMGAVVGGSLALGIYYAYDYGAPLVQSWLIRPGSPFTLGTHRVADKDFDETDTRHVQAQARRIAQTVQPVTQYSQDAREEQVAAYTPTEETETVEVAEEVVEESVSEPIAMQETDDEVVDSIWEEEWTKDDEDDVYVPPEVYEPVTGTAGTPVPDLPDSGFGFVALLAAAGAGVGSQYRRLKRK